MRILGISGSLRAASYNTALLRAAAQVAPDGVTIDIYEDLELLPPFNEDREDAPPAEVERLRAELESADAVLFATPEYNTTMPGPDQAGGRLGVASARPRVGPVGQARWRDRRQHDRLRRDVGAGPPAQGARASPARASWTPSCRWPRPRTCSPPTGSWSTPRRATGSPTWSPSSWPITAASPPAAA